MTGGVVKVGVRHHAWLKHHCTLHARNMASVVRYGSKLVVKLMQCQHYEQACERLAGRLMSDVLCQLLDAWGRGDIDLPSEGTLEYT